jgi:hypothetical protein
MTILTYDEIRCLVREAMDQLAVVPVPDDEPSPDLSDDDDDELPPLAPVSMGLVPSSIPLIPSFPEAVEDALDSSCVDDDDAL